MAELWEELPIQASAKRYRELRNVFDGSPADDPRGRRLLLVLLTALELWDNGDEHDLDRLVHLATIIAREKARQI